MAPPKSTATISKVMAPKIILVPNTNFTPSFRLFITGSPILGFKIGFFLILVKIRSAIKEKAKMRHMDQCTPIKFILKPAKAGPRTAAICQTELLQVAALGYTFLGTINAKRENMVGPKKDLTIPPRNTKK